MIQKLLDNRFFILYLLPFILGSLTVFSFQPYNLSLINFILLPIFFLLIVYVNKKSRSVYRKKPFKRNLFILGFVFGFAFFLSGIFWIANSLTFDDNFKILIPFAVILIPMFLALFTGATVLIVGKFLSYNFTSLILFSCSLSLSDFIRGKILTGFPWNLWGYSLSWFTEILQIINLIGLFSFNLLTITIFTIPAVLVFKYSTFQKILILNLTIFIIFLLYIYGTFKININQGLLNYLNKDNKIYTKVISPNFDLEYNISEKQIEKKLIKLIKYSDPNSERDTLFVWPEGVFAGFSFREISQFKSLIENNFNKNHYIAFGVNTFNSDNFNFYNSLVIVNHKFEIIQKYNKIKLVPFGEFLPFEKTLNKFGLKKITQGHGSFSKSETHKNLIFRNVNILPLICYEIIFTELIQKAGKETNLILNISEDGWFGKTIGPHQHFAKAIFRSIENNTFVIRSANKGISAIINNKGEVVKQLNTSEEGNIEMEIPLINSDEKNKNDLIFFLLLFTYLIIFLIFKNKTYER